MSLQSSVPHSFDGCIVFQWFNAPWLIIPGGHVGHFCCYKAGNNAPLCSTPVGSDAEISRFLDRGLLIQAVTSGHIDNETSRHIFL